MSWVFDAKGDFQDCQVSESQREKKIENFFKFFLHAKFAKQVH